MILATQSVKELAASGMLTVVAESCATKIFLANPDMEPAVYRDAFGLNDTELALISELVPPSQMLIRKHEGSKKVHLNVDSLSYWMATNNARDNVLKYQHLDQYGATELRDEFDSRRAHKRVFSKDRDFQEFLKSAEAANAGPSLRVRRVPQAVARHKELAKPKKAGV